MSASFSPKLNIFIKDPNDSFFSKEPTTFAEACSLLSALASAERANNPDLVRNVTPQNFATVFRLLAKDCAASVASSNQIKKMLTWYCNDTAGMEAALQLCEPHDFQPVLQMVSGNVGFNSQRGMIGVGQIAREVDRSIQENYRPDLLALLSQHIERRHKEAPDTITARNWGYLLDTAKADAETSRNYAARRPSPLAL